MKNFIKAMSITTMILFTTGCGSDVDRTNLDEDTSPTSKNKSVKKDPSTSPNDTNKTIHCEDLLKKDPSTLEILDSSLECPPNVDLYHAEVKPTYFKYQYDEEYKGNVLYFKSNELKNAIHILGYDAKERYEWNEHPNYQNKFNISWDAKFSNDFIIFVVVKFQNKNETIQKDLIYTTLQNNTDDINLSRFLPITLDNSYKDGQWHHYERNIMDDLHTFYPDAKIDYKENYYKNDQNEINGFALRGTGSITNIMLTK